MFWKFKTTLSNGHAVNVSYDYYPAERRMLPTSPVASTIAVTTSAAIELSSVTAADARTWDDFYRDMLPRLSEREKANLLDEAEADAEKRLAEIARRKSSILGSLKNNLVRAASEPCTSPADLDGHADRQGLAWEAE